MENQETKTEATPSIESQATPVKTGSSKLPLIIAAAVLAITFVAGIGYVVYDQVIKDDNDSEEDGDSDRDRDEDRSRSDRAKIEANEDDFEDGEFRDYLVAVFGASSSEDQSYRIESRTDSGDFIIERDAENKLSYTKISYEGEDYESYIDENGTSYTKLDGTWLKTEAEEDFSDELNLTEDLEESIDEELEFYEYEGKEDCPNDFGGDCFVFSYNNMDTETEGTIYISEDEGLIVRIVSITLDEDGNEEEVILDYSYDDIELELPDDAKDAQSYDEYFDSFESSLEESNEESLEDSLNDNDDSLTEEEQQILDELLQGLEE